MTLNHNKCEFSRKSLKFLGHIIGENGLKPDPNKVKAINSFLRSGTVTDVRQFLGMTNQLGKFLPKLSDVTEPLHELITVVVKMYSIGDLLKSQFSRGKAYT